MMPREEKPSLFDLSEVRVEMVIAIFPLCSICPSRDAAHDGVIRRANDELSRLVT